VDNFQELLAATQRSDASSTHRFCGRGKKIDDAYRIDLLVEDSLIIEVKTVEAFLPVHSAQLLTYLRMSEKYLGLLINFHTVRLVDGIKRQVHKFPT
jgi:GxxExxY protein